MNQITDNHVYQIIEELLAILDIDIQQIQHSLQTLDQLRALVIKRDDQGLQTLLEQIRDHGNQHTIHEARRERVRTELAQQLGVEVKQMTLSVLQGSLDQPLKDRIGKKKRQLRQAVGQLRAQYLSTSTLLHDCTRFNRALFSAIFQQNKTQPLVYGPKGTMKRHTANNLMNIQF